MNTFVHNPSPNGMAQEPKTLDKPDGEAAPAPEQSRPREWKSPLDGIEEGMRADQLESLGWLRRYGMGVAERLDRYSRGLLLARDLQEPFHNVDVTLAFSRVARAVRQIIVLEQETAGVREMRVPRAVAQRAPKAEAAPRDAESDAPPSDTSISRPADRDTEREADDLTDPDDIDDYDDYDDYRSGPVEEIAAQVRAELDAMPDAGRVARRLAEAPADMLAPLSSEPEPAQTFQTSRERLPGETAEEWHQRHLAARIRALEAKYGATGPP